MFIPLLLLSSFSPDEFTKTVLPRYFKATKFSSFTRKLYRWGFRQVNRGIGPEDPIVFGNEFFQRDAEELMTQMKSVTAASSKKNDKEAHLRTLQTIYGSSGLPGPTAFPSATSIAGQKRSLDSDANNDMTAKRQQLMLMEQLMQQKAVMAASALGGPRFGGLNMNLSNALRAGAGANAFASPFGNLAQLQALQQQQGVGLPQASAQLPNTQGAANGSNPQTTADIINAAISALRHG